MGSWIVDDGGNNTDGLTWATAYTSYESARAAEASSGWSAGDVLYFGHDHIDQYTYTANYITTGPNSSAGALNLVSVTQGTGSIAGGGFVYQPSTTLRQIDTSNNGANSYTLHFSQSIAVFGMSCRSGGNLTVNSSFYGGGTKDAMLSPGPNGSVQFNSSNSSFSDHVNLTIDGTLDGTTPRTGYILFLYSAYVRGLSFTNVAYRTGGVFYTTGFLGYASGVDLTGFTHATTFGIIDSAGAVYHLELYDVKVPATFKFFEGYPTSRGGFISMVNVGNAHTPSLQLYHRGTGSCLTTTSVYRSGGMTIEGTPCSFGGPSLGIETFSVCNQSYSFPLPWVNFVPDSTGTKTISMYLANNNSALQDDEVYLEVEVLGTSGSPLSAYYSNRVAPLGTPAAHATDSISTWNGDTFTYKQKLSVGSVVIGQAGQARARVVLIKPSIAAADDLYVDNYVEVS